MEITDENEQQVLYSMPPVNFRLAYFSSLIREGRIHRADNDLKDFIRRHPDLEKHPYVLKLQGMIQAEFDEDAKKMRDPGDTEEIENLKE